MVVAAISARGHSSVLVTEDGAVYSWGCGRDGRLGHGLAKVGSAPIPKPKPDKAAPKIGYDAEAEAEAAALLASMPQTVDVMGFKNYSLPTVVLAISHQPIQRAALSAKHLVVFCPTCVTTIEPASGPVEGSSKLVLKG